MRASLEANTQAQAALGSEAAAVKSEQLQAELTVASAGKQVAAAAPACFGERSECLGEWVMCSECFRERSERSTDSLIVFYVDGFVATDLRALFAYFRGIFANRLPLHLFVYTSCSCRFLIHLVLSEAEATQFASLLRTSPTGAGGQPEGRPRDAPGSV